VLSYTTPEELAEQSPVVRYLHVVILMAIRDRTEQVEFRSTEEGWLLYQRNEGRDWEMIPPPEDVQLHLKDTLRQCARLVAPERPEGQITFGIENARLEPQEIGWLTYQVSGHVLDLAIRIDPREPYGRITLNIEYAAEHELAGQAGEALADYLGQLEETDLE
jgi:hypothetical protein